MRKKLVQMVMEHVGGVQINATDNELWDELEAHMDGMDDRLNELLGFIAEIRGHVLSTIWYLDVSKYEELLGPCVASPEEVVGAAQVLEELTSSYLTAKTDSTEVLKGIGDESGVGDGIIELSPDGLVDK